MKRIPLGKSPANETVYRIVMRMAEQEQELYRRLKRQLNQRLAGKTKERRLTSVLRRNCCAPQKHLHVQATISSSQYS